MVESVTDTLVCGEFAPVVTAMVFPFTDATVPPTP
jgi:hypothetical protein